MKRTVLLVFLVLFLFTPQNACAYTKYDLPFNLEPMDYDFIVLGPLEMGDRMAITVSCDPFYYIDFLLCDQENFNAWVDGFDSWAYMDQKDIAGIHQEFEVHTHGYYYFVVFNNDTESISTGLLKVEYYPHESLDPLPIIIGIEVLIIIIGVGAYLIHRRRKNRVDKQGENNV